MAQLSAHPSILTVHQAGVSSDGRPYLVMELCSAALNQEYPRASAVGARRAADGSQDRERGRDRAPPRSAAPRHQAVEHPHVGIRAPGAVRLRHRRHDRRPRVGRRRRSVDPVVGTRGDPRRDAWHGRERGLGDRGDALLAARRTLAVRDPRRRDQLRRPRGAHHEGEAPPPRPRRRPRAARGDPPARDVEAAGVEAVERARDRPRAPDRRIGAGPRADLRGGRRRQLGGDVDLRPGRSHQDHGHPDHRHGGSPSPASPPVRTRAGSTSGGRARARQPHAGASSRARDSSSTRTRTVTLAARRRLGARRAPSA